VYKRDLLQGIQQRISLFTYTKEIYFPKGGANNAEHNHHDEIFILLHMHLIVNRLMLKNKTKNFSTLNILPFATRHINLLIYRNLSCSE
jgi:hypothetical protein